MNARETVAAMTSLQSNFESDRHALYVGWVVGMARKHGLRVIPVIDDHGDYTDHIEVELPANETRYGIDHITVVIGAPPEEWHL
jgi:hypothetical protein